MKKIISLVTPVYNEEENIDDFYQQALETIKDLEDHYDFEFIFTDNHSYDKTWLLLKSIAEKDNRVKIIRFSRNFGYQRSILTGYLNATGSAAIQLDCDLQDPIELIHEFIKLWEQGYNVVYGIRKRRKEGLLINQLRKLYYRIVNQISEHSLPVDAGDFRLVDRRILEELRLIKDDAPYLRGTISEMGFRQVGIPYDRRARTKGESKFRMKDLLSLSIDGVLNHSIYPLKIVFYFGLIVFLLSIIVTIFVFFSHWVAGSNWPRGFTTIVLLQIFSIAINTLFLGILGAYIGRIFNQVKNKPITIVEEQQGQLFIPRKDLK